MKTFKGKTFSLVIHKWEFALIISIINIIAAYGVPYIVAYFVTGLWQNVVTSAVLLVLNILVVWLSIEENNAPELPKPES
jgi:hypothetical protein